MKFWEDFFSTDKIIYPFITTILFGCIIKFLSLITNKYLSDELLIIFMFIGFLLGNYIKIQKIETSRKSLPYRKKTITKK